MIWHRVSLAIGLAMGGAFLGQAALTQTIEQGGAPPSDDAASPQPNPQANNPANPGEHVDRSENVRANPNGPKVIVQVDLTAQMMHVQFPDGTTADWPVSSGRPGLDTPDGHYKAQWIDPDHLSKQYQDAPMPYAVFFDLKGHAFHGSYQKKFGVAVSHGCVRLPVEDAKKLFDAVKANGADIDITGQAHRNTWALRQEDQRELAEAAQGNANGYGYGGASPQQQYGNAPPPRGYTNAPPPGYASNAPFHSTDPNDRAYPPYPGQDQQQQQQQFRPPQSFFGIQLPGQ
jgi:lipoprotein-anchoring transpeptidase ErfK/SrfK